LYDSPLQRVTRPINVRFSSHVRTRRVWSTASPVICRWPRGRWWSTV